MSSLTLPIPVNSTTGPRRVWFYSAPAAANFVDVEAKATADDSRAWFWTKKWQAGETRVDELIDAGEVEVFEDMGDFLTSLGLDE